MKERNENEMRNKKKHTVADGQLSPDYIETSTGIAIPYEWYQEYLGDILFSQGVEEFGLKKAKSEAYNVKLSKETLITDEKGEPVIDTDKKGLPVQRRRGESVIKKMGATYRTLYIDKFTKETDELTNTAKLDPIRCIEHRRVMYKLINDTFPLLPEQDNTSLKAILEPIAQTQKVQTQNQLLNKALKALIFNPSIEDMIKQFEEENTIVIEETEVIKDKVIHKSYKILDGVSHKSYITSINPKDFEKLEKWMSTYFYSVHGPKVYFDFTGLLFICTNLNNKEFLNRPSKEDKENNKKIKIMDVNKTQNTIISACHRLKNADENKTKFPNAYVLNLIKNIKSIHKNLKHFIMFTDLEGDDMSALLSAYKYLPQDITLKIFIQHSEQLLSSELK
jgi:hypothetical protein